MPTNETRRRKVRNQLPVSGFRSNNLPRDQRMAAYDALPASVRRALDGCCIKLCAISAKAMWRRQGVRNTVAHINKADARARSALRQEQEALADAR